MSYWEDVDDHLGRLEPNDLNLDYVGVSHLDCVSRVVKEIVEGFCGEENTFLRYFYWILIYLSLLYDTSI